MALKIVKQLGRSTSEAPTNTWSNLETGHESRGFESSCDLVYDTETASETEEVG